MLSTSRLNTFMECTTPAGHNDPGSLNLDFLVPIGTALVPGAGRA